MPPPACPFRVFPAPTPAAQPSFPAPSSRDEALSFVTRAIVLRPSDLDFPVTTDSTQVRAFLAAPFAGVKLVFSTYQSADIVAAGL